MPPSRAALLLAAVALLWGANWPVIKVGLEDIPPFAFAAFRMAMGAATLFAVLAGGGTRPRLPDRRDLLPLTLVAVLQMTLFLAAINYGLQFVPAGRSSVLAYTTPLWVAPVALLLLGERANAFKLAGLAAGVGGLAALFNPLALDWQDGRQILGNLVLLGAAASWAASILVLRSHRWHGSALAIAPWQMSLAALLLAGLAFILAGERPSDIHWTPRLLAVLAFNGPLATGFCFWATVAVSRALPTLTTSLGLLAVPVAGVAFSSLTLGESVTPSLLLGLLGILGGIALVLQGDRRERQAPHA